MKNANGVKELKGTLRISHMIPVPESELHLYDMDNETDSTYKDRVPYFLKCSEEDILK